MTTPTNNANDLNARRAHEREKYVELASRPGAIAFSHSSFTGL